MSETGGSPLISVIISNYDASRLRDIIDLIDSLICQTYGNLEIVLVTEVSELCGLIRSHITGSRLESLRCLVVPLGIGASAARNAGIRIARGDVLAFVDDDIVLSPNWAREVVNTLQIDDSFIGAIGSVSPIWKDTNMSWLPPELEWLVSCTGWLDKRGVYPIRGHTWTSNASFKREAFQSGIGFSEKLGPLRGLPGWKRANISEDVELSMRIQAATSNLVVYNSAIKSWKKIERSSLSWERIVSCSIGIGKSRVSKQRLFGEVFGSDLMTVEKDLLYRILLRLIPQVIKKPKNLRIVTHIFLITVTAILSLSIGYAESILT